MNWKQLFPRSLKVFIKLQLLNFKDWQEGNFKFFVKKEKNAPILNNAKIQFELNQPIFQTSRSKNKIHNLKIARSKLESIIFHPHQIFSLWRIIGAPTIKNGYKKGRNLIAGKLQEDVGGGCVGVYFC